MKTVKVGVIELGLEGREFGFSDATQPFWAAFVYVLTEDKPKTASPTA